MDGIRNGENDSAVLALAVPESQFMQDLRSNLPAKLLRLGSAMCAAAAGGLVKQLVVDSARSGQAEAEGVPLSQSSQLPQFLLLLATLLGALGTIYAGVRVEMEMQHSAPTPTRRWRKAGVAIYFSCLLLLVAAVSLVGSDYCDLALNFMDED